MRWAAVPSWGLTLLHVGADLWGPLAKAELYGIGDGQEWEGV